jgi:hypothetical protein
MRFRDRITPEGHANYRRTFGAAAQTVIENVESQIDRYLDGPASLIKAPTFYALIALRGF